MNRFKSFTILLGALIVASMTSCTKEGVYTPKTKIKRVYASSTYSDKYLRQSWEWDGKLLESINYYSSSGSLSWTENFSYDGKRLVRVDDYLGSEYTTYEYDGKYLKNVNYYYKNSLEATANYTYNSGKLSKMTLTYYESKSGKKGHLASSYTPFPSEIAEAFNKCIAKAESNNQEKGIEIMTYQFTWDGDNVSKVVATFEGELATITLQYDNKNNPQKGFHSLYSDVDEDMGPVFRLAKNNITKMIVNYDGENEVLNYTYQYNSDNYPTMQIEQYPDEDYQFVTYYEYE